MRISILTATYNREKLLTRLYKSIKDNYKKYKDVEWIIVDDGSSDNTKKKVTEWIKEAKFKIDYHYQENQGKMVAINKGMEYVTGEIVIELDSDDYLLDNVLEGICEDYKKLDDKTYGIIYRRDLGNKDTSGIEEMSGGIYKLFDIHNKYGCDFDTTLTFKTDIRRKYKYEVEDDEKFVTEARTYYKIDKDYDGALVINRNIVSGEYMEDGYSKNIDKIFKNNPKGYYKFFNECLSYIDEYTLFKKKLYFVKHYILFSYLIGKSKKECIDDALGCKWLVMLLVIPGYWKSKRY